LSCPSENKAPSEKPAVNELPTATYFVKSAVPLVIGAEGGGVAASTSGKNGVAKILSSLSEQETAKTSKAINESFIVIVFISFF